MKKVVVAIPSLDGRSKSPIQIPVEAAIAGTFWERFRGVHAVESGVLWLPKVRAVHGWTLEESLWVAWLDPFDGVLASRWLHPGRIEIGPPHAAGALEISLAACRRLVCDD